MAEAEASEIEDEVLGSVLVVDPDPGLRNAAEDLEDELDRPVVAMDSTDFDPAASEEVQAASVFIVAWDLGIRSGADLLESIRRDERLATRPVIIALDRATPARVETAIAVGADSVCLRPYDLEEVRARLEGVERRGECA